jgi:hypothetical protein
VDGTISDRSLRWLLYLSWMVFDFWPLHSENRAGDCTSCVWSLGVRQNPGRLSSLSFDNCVRYGMGLFEVLLRHSSIIPHFGQEGLCTIVYTE